MPTTPLRHLYEVLADHGGTIHPEGIEDALNKLLDRTKITSLHEPKCISAFEDAAQNDDLLGPLLTRFILIHQGDATIMRKLAYLELRERARLVRVQDLRGQLGDLYGSGTAEQTEPTDNGQPSAHGRTTVGTEAFEASRSIDGLMPGTLVYNATALAFTALIVTIQETLG
jgi:hypothetical protein